MDPAFISRSNIDKCIKIMSNKIGHKVTPWKMLLFILFSYSSLPHPMFLLLMLIPDSSFSWLFNHIPCIISNLKDFEALQNPVIRNHIIGFLYSKSRQHSILSFFSCSFPLPFCLSLADLWFLYWVSCTKKKFCSFGNSFSFSICP